MLVSLPLDLKKHSFLIHLVWKCEYEKLYILIFFFFTKYRC